MYDIALVIDLAVALLIGALVGIDREKKQEEEGAPGIGGIRTFILYAEAGAVSALLSRHLQNVWIFIATVVAVAFSVIAGYMIHSRKKPESVGMTTEISAMVVCLLGGAVVFGYREIAVMLAVVTSATLAFKKPIHGVVEKFGTDDIYAGLKLLIATFVVLPLLPDHTVDPWQALNPYRLWLLVILISSLSLVGYVATRWLGSNRGAAVMGLTGGLVSSTAVTLTFAKQSREEGGSIENSLAAGILLAWGIMFARVVVEVLAVNPALVFDLLVPFSGMMVVAVVIAMMYFRRGDQEKSRGSNAVPLSNPFSLRSAIKFALFFAAILIIVKLVQTYSAGAGLYAVAALAGLSDVDAITLSMADYAKQGGDSRTAVISIVIASMTNTGIKCIMTAALGSAVIRNRVMVATFAILACGLILLAL